MKNILTLGGSEFVAINQCIKTDVKVVAVTNKYSKLTVNEGNKDASQLALLQAVRREHTLRFRDRFMSSGKFLQPVEALGAIAHIPNEDINTPVIDWAKQDTGPGTPSSGVQLEDQEREQQKVEETGIKDTLNQNSNDDNNVGVEDSSSKERVEQPISEPPSENVVTSETGNTQSTPESTVDRWGDVDVTSTKTEVEEENVGAKSEMPDANSSFDGWMDEQTDDTDANTNTDSSDSEKPAFASKFDNDGWESTSDAESDSSSIGNRRK